MSTCWPLVGRGKPKPGTFISPRKPHDIVGHRTVEPRAKLANLIVHPALLDDARALFLPSLRRPR
jgi:hypothetical protein